jgi:hypothetical protein
MLKKRGIKVTLFSFEHRRNYLLENLRFKDAVYSDAKKSSILEKIAHSFHYGLIDLMVSLKLIIYADENELHLKVCQLSVSHVKQFISNLSFIREYLKSDFVKNEDENLILEDIARYIIED